MLVYMIRHGQSTANRDGVLSGQMQWPLSDLGIEQARQVDERLRAVTDFDRIYVSDLLRTRQTFEHAFGPVEHTLSPLIREIDIPFAGLSKAEALARHGEAFTRAMEGLEFADFGGESQAQVIERVLAFRSLLEQEKDAQHVAVVPRRHHPHLHGHHSGRHAQRSEAAHRQLLGLGI